MFLKFNFFILPPVNNYLQCQSKLFQQEMYIDSIWYRKHISQLSNRLYGNRSKGNYHTMANTVIVLYNIFDNE